MPLAAGRWAVATGAMPLDAVVAAVRTAEAAGCEAALVGENPLECDAVVASAAALAATSTIRVGPAMIAAYDRHPLVTARAAATLDRLAPSRTLVGIGRGDPGVATDALGLPATSTATLADTLAVLRSLLAGGRCDHDGERWTAHLGPLPARAAPRGRVPLIVAAVGQRALRLAGAVADAVALNYGAPVEYVGWALDEVRRGAAAAGRDPAAVDVLGYLLVARTDRPGGDAAAEEVRRALAWLLALPGQGGALLRPAGLRLGGGVDDRLLRRCAAVGDGREVMARVEEYRAAGIRCPVLLPAGLRALSAG